MKLRTSILGTALALLTTSAFAAPVSYTIDPSHTDVIAQWNHFGFSNPIANFNGTTGTIVYDAANVAKSSVQVTIPLSGLDANVDKLTTHLSSAEFFDAAKFPTITFKSTRVEAAGAGKLKVTGDLTVKGVTKPAVLAVVINKVGEQPMAKRAAAGFDATTTLKRSDFGISGYVPNVSDEIKIRLTTEAVVPAAAGAK